MEFEFFRIEGDRRQHIALEDPRRVAGDAPRGEFERMAVEIHQRDARRGRRKPSLVEEIAAANSDVEMIGSNT